MFVIWVTDDDSLLSNFFSIVLPRRSALCDMEVVFEADDMPSSDWLSPRSPFILIFLFGVESIDSRVLIDPCWLTERAEG